MLNYFRIAFNGDETFIYMVRSYNIWLFIIFLNSCNRSINTVTNRVVDNNNFLLLSTKQQQLFVVVV